MDSKTKTILITAALVALIATVPLQIESRANTHLQGELTVAQKQVATLKAGQHKLETQLASQSQELQVLQAGQQMQTGQSSLSTTNVGGMATSGLASVQTRPVANPRAPSPGVYPNRPKFSVQDFTPESMIRIQYGNLFQKMQFTPEQADAFVKLLLDQQQQENAIRTQLPLDTAGMANLTMVQKQAAMDQHDQQLEQQTQTTEQNTAAQLQALLGSADNMDYYNTYADQTKERAIITAGYANQLANANVPPLTVDQEEQVVNLVYQYRTALNGSGVGGVPIPPDQQAQILQQAGTFLSPDQVTVLQTVMPSLAAPYHKSTMGGG